MDLFGEFETGFTTTLNRNQLIEYRQNQQPYGVEMQSKASNLITACEPNPVVYVEETLFVHSVQN